MKKKTAIFITLLVLIVCVRYAYEFYHINKDLFPFIDRNEAYPTAREVLNEDKYADIISLDNYIYMRNKDWGVITSSKAEDYLKDREIGDIKKTTTNELWFRSLYASKLKEGTTVYSEDRDYRRGDAPLHITIEEDGEVVFYEKVIKDDDIEDKDPEVNDEDVQTFINNQLEKINKDIDVTKANVINDEINIDVVTDYDKDLDDDADMETVIYTAFSSGIDVSNMIGQIFYMNKEIDWETITINMDKIGSVDISRQLYVGMDDKLEEAATSEAGFYTNHAIEEELVRKAEWKLYVQESHVNGYILDVLEEK